MRRSLPVGIVALFGVLVATPSPAAPEAWNPFPTDFPFASSSVTAPAPVGTSGAKNTTNKAVSIRVGPAAAVVFDTDLLRLSAAWTGGFLTPTGVALDTSHGGHPQVAGEVQVATRPGPGWADAQGRFDDPRKPGPFGPLPESWARWDGLYVVGPHVVLAYTVHGAKVLEQPAALSRNGHTVFTRTFRIAEAPRALTLRVADVEGAPTIGRDGSRLSVTAGGRITQVAATGARLEFDKDGRVLLRVPAGRPGLIRVAFGNAPVAQQAAIEAVFASLPAPAVADVSKGGPRHWPHEIVTRGVRGTGQGPYVVDRLTTPFPGTYHRSPIADWKDNVYKRRLMIGGFDFFADGKRAAVATWEGDVWIVEGIDEDLDKITWRRFASGGYETLGLKIVDDVIYTSGRDQITRYHDLNGDGEADHYENFNNGVTASPGFHEFQFDLHTDAQGNFYTAKAAPVRAGGRGFGGGGGNGEMTIHAGTIQRISKDGKRREIYASGLRAPNGIGVGPNGQVTAGDNEGTWVPACPLHWVKPGAFLGVEDTAQRSPIPSFTPPLCWISKTYDNSGGSQVWVPNDTRWGPWGGQLLHLTYGRAAIYAVLPQKVNELMQGGIVRLFGGSDAAQLTGTAQKLTSSAMRARFNARDGQLYVAGLQGWQTDAVSTTGFDRIRYTGKEVYSVRGLSVTAAGVHLTFSHPLDPASVSDGNFSGERWNYKRTSQYGSPEFSVSDPEMRGHDRLDVLAAELLPDGRTVRLTIDDLRPVHQMLLKFKVKATDGTRISQTVMHTIHVVPPDPSGKTGPAVASRRGRPGLALAITGAGARDDLVANNVALFVASGRAPSPLVPPGRFQAVWEGTLSPELRGEHTFAAELSGTLQLELGGKPVGEFGGSGTRTVVGTPVLLEKGETKFRAIYTAPAKGDAFVRLSWRGDQGGPFEPLPAAALRRPLEPAPLTAERLRLGRELYLEHRCARCHLDKLPRGPAPELAMDAPSFAGLGSRLTERWISEWLARPRASTWRRMPVLLHGEKVQADARAVAAFLAKGAKASPEDAPSPQAIAEGERLWNDLNCGGCHSPLMQQLSDDGKLALDHVNAKFTPASLRAFLRAPEAHYQWTRMPNFRLTDAEAAALQAYIRANAGGARDKPLPAPTPAEVARGREIVEGTGCLSCHQMPGVRNRFKVVAIRDAASKRSCIDGADAHARYTFTPTQQAALRAFVTEPAALASLARHAPAEYAARQVRGLQCNACHGQLDGFPTLDGVGEKLRPEWSTAFIAGRVPYKPRPEKHADGQPWLAARMPAFATRASLLSEGLAAAHGIAPRTPPAPPIDRGAAKLGEALVSANGGFSCVTCHGVGKAAATQVFESEGINLAHSAERLLPAYFRRWMRNPLKVDPQTKMPVYFDDEGQSPLTTILGGDGEKQITALWEYVRLLGGKR